MTAPVAKPKRCSCGRMPDVRARQVAEDVVMTWVECGNLRCRATGSEIEDAYLDDAAAIDQWNRVGGRKVA